MNEESWIYAKKSSKEFDLVKYNMSLCLYNFLIENSKTENWISFLKSLVWIMGATESWNLKSGQQSVFIWASQITDMKNKYQN